MILTPCDVKFHEKKDELPPRACRTSKKLKKNNDEKVEPKKVKTQKTMSIKRVPRPPARPPAQAGGPGGGSPLARGKKRYKY